jgi:hypothetical protein
MQARYTAVAAIAIGSSRRCARMNDWKDGVTRTYLIVSEGVTAMIASIIPAPKPASIDLGADSFPWKTQSERSP